MPPAIHQLLAGFSNGDAISNEARVLRGLFRGWGRASEIFCEHRRVLPELRADCRDRPVRRAAPEIPSTCRAAVLVEKERIEVREFPIRDITDDEILIRVEPFAARRKRRRP